MLLLCFNRDGRVDRSHVHRVQKIPVSGSTTPSFSFFSVFFRRGLGLWFGKPIFVQCKKQRPLCVRNWTFWVRFLYFCSFVTQQYNHPCPFVRCPPNRYTTVLARPCLYRQKLFKHAFVCKQTRFDEQVCLCVCVRFPIRNAMKNNVQPRVFHLQYDRKKSRRQRYSINVFLFCSQSRLTNGNTGSRVNEMG